MSAWARGGGVSDDLEQMCTDVIELSPNGPDVAINVGYPAPESQPSPMHGVRKSIKDLVTRI